jgi:hypothetical protein
LDVLNRSRPAGWLKVDAHLRDLGSEGRDNLATTLRDLKPTLKEHSVRRILFGDENPIQIWLSSDSIRPNVDEIQRQGEIACLVAKRPSVLALILKCDVDGTMGDANCTLVRSPPIIRNDYVALAAEADRQRSRYIAIGKKGQKRSDSSKRARR